VVCGLLLGLNLFFFFFCPYLQNLKNEIDASSDDAKFGSVFLKEQRRGGWGWGELRT